MKRIFAAFTAALLVVPLVSSVALAAPKTNLWNLYSINSGGTSYTPKIAPSSEAGIANFSFPSTADAALLTTSQDASLLGNLTGKTITATFTVDASSDAVFIYGGEPDGSGAPATARLYFQSNNGKFAYTNYWWSNPAHFTFVDGFTGTFTLTVPVATGNWSDWNGHSDSSVSDAFAQAVANVNQIGLSFGGGFFFANGVGVSPGSADFHLVSYSLADTVKVDYYTVSGDATFNPAGSFCRSAAPRTSVPLAGSGTASQALTSSRAVALTTTGVTSNYADNGFYAAVGTLADITSGYSIAASGTAVTTNLWFDTGGDGNFFAWDANSCMTGLNGDTYAAASPGTATVTGSTTFQIFAGIGAGNTYTLDQLEAGDAGFPSTTPVAVWVGFVGNGSATITAAP